MLPMPIAAGLTASAVVAVAVYFYRVEGWTGEALASGLILATLAAALVLVSGRAMFATILVAALVGAIHIVSQAKQQATGITLHSYDFVGMITGPRQVEGNWAWAAADASAALWAAAAAVAAWLVYRLDPTRLRRAPAAVALLALTALSIAASHARGDRRHTEFYFEDIYVSPFIASWAETAGALTAGGMLPAGAVGGPKLAVPETCTPTGRPPHIILIHQESVAPPSLFPTLSYDRSLDAMFRSQDGVSRKLRVETYGGASWLTEFTIMTGLSSLDFGGMRHMVQPVMAGKVRETLPQVLGRCGYHRLMVYPMLRNYMSIDRFYSSVGIDEIIDARQQKAKRANERDGFYYASLLDAIARHTAARGSPLFAFVQTMSTHGGYEYAYDAEVDVPGGGPGTEPEMHEYLRRLGLARLDYDGFSTALSRRFPGEPFLILRYGDHQPTATRTLLGFPPSADVEAVVAGANPLSMISYYAIDAIGHTLPPLPDIDTLDVAYLGTVLIEAAGLPLSDTYRERRRLMHACGGHYHDCPRRAEVLRFHRRLIDSGIVKPL